MLETVLAYISYEPVQRWGPLSPHGVGTAAGFLLGAVAMARRAEPRGIPRQDVYNAVTWGAVGAIIGARGFYVLAHADQFGSIRDVLAVWEGGLTMFGGFVGGLALGLYSLHREGYHIPTALDAAAPGFVIGVLMGRIGDLVIADHLGEPTTFFLGYRIPQGADLAPGYGPPTYVPGAVVHQTALYDLVGVLVLAGVLAVLARRTLPPGALFATFALWYGLQRFAIDFTRNRDVIESFFFGLSGSQWAGLAFAVAGAFWLGRSKGTTAPEVPPAADVAPDAAAPVLDPPPADVPAAEPQPEPSTPAPDAFAGALPATEAEREAAGGERPDPHGSPPAEERGRPPEEPGRPAYGPAAQPVEAPEAMEAPAAEPVEEREPMEAPAAERVEPSETTGPAPGEPAEPERPSAHVEQPGAEQGAPAPETLRGGPPAVGEERRSPDEPGAPGDEDEPSREDPEEDDPQSSDRPDA